VKSDRLVAMLLALQEGGKQSAPELARSLEVSTRTIYRDIDALSAAGVPIYAERGVRGGVVLADAYRETLARFDEGELRALFVSSDDVLADVGLVARRGSALSKLAAALPRTARSTIERDRGRVHVDPRRWYGASHAPELLSALREAVWNDCRVLLTYRDRNGGESKRTLDPLGLVAKAGVWYVVARDADTIKSFRVDRIVDAAVLGERFLRPPGFDVGEYWKSTSASFVRDASRALVVTFAMSDRALENAKSYLDVLSFERAGDEWRVRVQFASIDYAEREAFAYDDAAVVLEPPELRERLLERARALTARYNSAT
jgi:predicted DNA-binding transcriptional regulator YafY